MSEVISKDPAVSNGFFSTLGDVFSGVGKGLQFTAQEVIPRFFSQELLNQQFDRLQQPTFVPAFAPNRIDQGTIDNTGTPQKTGLLFDNFNISSGGLLIGAAAIIGVILVARAK
ncbi:MAG TPA: hypothetical protein VKA67_01985 [Verrucomicrobiae bacterium]|nr:hypothetical protein [Verrucomicrobiae bacterium]